MEQFFRDWAYFAVAIGAGMMIGKIGGKILSFIFLKAYSWWRFR